MRRCACLLVLFLWITSTLRGQSPQIVSGSYRYVVPDHVSLEAAKITAVEKARTEALAAAFGTIITQSNTTVIENSNDASEYVFLSVGGSDVNGEWLEDTQEPEVVITAESGFITIIAKVWGRVREIRSTPIDIHAKLLRNGTEEKFESERFKDGDDLFLLFSSPVDGHLAAYLVDRSQQVYCLLPYSTDPRKAYTIQGGKEYLFFSASDTEGPGQVDEYRLTCDKSYEYDRIYLIFSPNEFTKANDKETGSSLPRMLSFEQYNKWLAKARIRDKDMQVISKIILIKK